MATFAHRPSPSFGYWRGVGAEGPLYLGQGSGYGPARQGLGVLPQGSGSVGTAGSGAWTPTVVYMFVLVVAELVIFKLLERALR